MRNHDHKYILDVLRAQKMRLVAANVTRWVPNHMHNYQAAEKKRGYSFWGLPGAPPAYATVQRSDGRKSPTGSSGRSPGEGVRGGA